MRTRGLMRIDGNLIATWVDHGPGYARTAHHSGELAVGVSESTQKDGRNRRWREKQPEKDAA